jgi:hypothetical protein
VFDVGDADTNGDGVFDTTFDPATGDLHHGPFAQFDDGSTWATPGAGGSDGSDGSDGGVGGDDTVHGDPMAEIPYHQAQVGAHDCLPTSVAMVLSEVTGTEVPAGEVVDLANDLGLMGGNGMSLEGGLALMDHYGVHAEVQTGTIDELRTMLDADVPVIIGLDSDDLYGAGDGPFADNMVSGHAVVITGIDDEAGLVYINDPGFPDGAGVAIPIQEFEDAWKDADHEMIVAGSGSGHGGDVGAGDAGRAGDAGPDAATAPVAAPDEGSFDSVARLVLLPFDLVLR